LRRADLSLPSPFFSENFSPPTGLSGTDVFPFPAPPLYLSRSISRLLKDCARQHPYHEFPPAAVCSPPAADRYSFFPGCTKTSFLWVPKPMRAPPMRESNGSDDYVRVPPPLPRCSRGLSLFPSFHSYDAGLFSTDNRSPSSSLRAPDPSFRNW